MLTESEKCEPCTYSPEQGVDSLPTSSSDIPQWLQSSGNHTLVEFSENGRQTVGSPDCKCGRGTLDCSIHPSTPEAWTAFMQDSLAKTLALLDARQDSVREPEAGFTEKSCELLATLDQDSSSWKMSLLLKAKDLKRYSKTWPSWGMTQGGSAFVHPMSGRTIIETDGLLLPTPTAHNAKEGGYPAEGTRNTPTLGWVLGGRINPQFTEWMMGWPMDYTALKQSEMDKSPSRLPQLLPSWLGG